MQAYLRLVNSGYRFTEKPAPLPPGFRYSPEKIIRQFVENTLEMDVNDESSVILTQALYTAYGNYLKNNGIPEEQLPDLKAFSTLFHKQYPELKKTRLSRGNAYRGIRFRA